MIKKNFLTIFCCVLIVAVIFNIDTISDELANILSSNPPLVIEPTNDYTKNYDFAFVKRNNDYIPYSYQDLLDIIYSIINNGWTTFTFYCPNEYETCLEDFNTIMDDDLLISQINNYVHPYNSVDSGKGAMRATISSSGEITINIRHFYNTEEINKINNEVDRIIASEIDSDDDDYDKLKKIHDYIINNTKYDVLANTNNSPYDSKRATGALFEHYATCNGYTDITAIFLTRLGFENFKVSTSPEEISYESKGHIWNAVYINNEWVHLDLTWDDPTDGTDNNYLYHKYFLVNTEEMQKADAGKVQIEEHNFNKSIFTELVPQLK